MVWYAEKVDNQQPIARLRPHRRYSVEQIRENLASIDGTTRLDLCKRKLN